MSLFSRIPTSQSNSGIASIITGIGGMPTSAMNSYFSSATQKIMLETQAYIADINARMAEANAQNTLLQGQKKIAALTLQVGQLKSKQRAAIAASGIDLGVGNAAEAQASTEIMKDIDKNAINANTLRDTWSIRMQAVSQQNLQQAYAWARENPQVLLLDMPPRLQEALQRHGDTDTVRAYQQVVTNPQSVITDWARFNRLLANAAEQSSTLHVTTVGLSKSTCNLRGCTR